MADPVTLLAFANDQEGKRYLRDLPEELRQLQAILEAAERKGLCELVVRPNATLDQIFDAFTEYRDRVVIFHYGGHASSDGLFLESTVPEGAVAHAEGLARFLGQRRNLELVFLNGCSTRAQAAGLLEAGVAAVIATARAIEDTVALEFAAAFYSELAAGATLRAAYEAARGRVLASRGSAPGCLLPHPRPRRDDRATPRERGRPRRRLRVPLGAAAGTGGRAGTALEPSRGGRRPAVRPAHAARGFVARIPLPGASGRSPGAEAAVFFGRGKAIRELYNLVTDPGTRPVILYYGPTGAGKSSVLAAGLLPRLEIDHEVRYLRRNSDLGLLGTLRQGLGTGGAANEQASGPGRSLARVRTARSAADRGPRSGRGGVHRPSSRFASSAEDHAPDPRSSETCSRRSRGRLSRSRTPRSRPRGKLILGFRNEWLDRVQQASPRPSWAGNRCR